MANAFNRATDSIANNKDMGLLAHYISGGVGEGAWIKVTRSAPDELVDALSSQIVRHTDVIHVRMSDVAQPTKTDIVMVGMIRLAVAAFQADAEGVTWKLFCKRMP